MKIPTNNRETTPARRAFVRGHADFIHGVPRASNPFASTPLSQGGAVLMAMWSSGWDAASRGNDAKPKGLWA